MQSFDERGLAGLILAARDRIPAEARRVARRHLIDYVGVTIAGLTEPGPRILVDTLAAGPSSAGPCSVLGSGLRTDPATAILCNAMSGHVHDFDDDDALVSYSHVSVPVLAAAWASAETHGNSAREMMDAYILGVEVMFFLGRLLNPGHYHKGWHASATFGVFGAATAAALLTRADEAQLAAALALAATMASGTRSSFGSDGKPFQLARAAQSGHLAATLAVNGLAASRTIFGPMGFLDLYGSPPLEGRSSAEPFGSPFGLVSPGVTIKASPSCTATHTTIEAAIDLRMNDGISPADVEAVEIEVGAGVPGILIHDRPETALQGKFSIQFCYAAALNFGRLGIAEFIDANIHLPAIRDLMPRIAMREAKPDGKGERSNLLAVTTITRLKDGRLLTRRIEDPKGSPARPLSDTELRAKFIASAGLILGDQRASIAYEALLGLETVRLNEIDL